MDNNLIYKNSIELTITVKNNAMGLYTINIIGFLRFKYWAINTSELRDGCKGNFNTEQLKKLYKKDCINKMLDDSRKRLNKLLLNETDINLIIWIQSFILDKIKDYFYIEYSNNKFRFKYNKRMVNIGGWKHLDINNLNYLLNR